MYVFIISYKDMFGNCICSESEITLNQFYSCMKNTVYLYTKYVLD